VFEICAAAAVVSGIGARFPSATRADSIDAILLQEAPRVMKYLKDHHYGTVGVLRFVVKKGAQPASLNAGTLNAMMAARVEHALILLNDPARPIDVIHDASRFAAAQSRSATLRNAQGHHGLFEHAYPLAWGAQKKRPDAFLTGEVLVEKTMKTLTIVIQAFDAKKPETIEEVLRVRNVPTDRNVLASIGQSFVLSRRLGHRSARDLDAAAADDASKRDETGANPLQDGDGPVKLEIFYDRTPVTLEADAGSPGEVQVQSRKAADPKQGQKVKFVVSNVSKDTVGVVLAVNGKSTLFLDDLTSKSPGQCTKWILAPGESYTIEGFYMTEDGKDVRAFKVLSDEESAKANLPPAQKGVYSLFVFRPVAAGTGTATALNITAEGGELSQSPQLDPGTHSLAETQAGLQASNHTRSLNGRLVAERPRRPTSPARHATQKGGRGLVVEDTQGSAGSHLNRVKTQFDPQPAMALSIRYTSGPATPGPQ
jgi:hypothetical protein